MTDHRKNCQILLDKSVSSFVDFLLPNAKSMAEVAVTNLICLGVDFTLKVPLLKAKCNNI